METILVIDDDKEICDTIVRTLSSKEFNFVIRHNGSDALDIKKYSLVLLDVYIGTDNGIEILQSLYKKNPEIPIIMISGESDIETAIKAIKIGAFDFLEKPLSRNKLKVTVKNAIKTAQQNKENIKLKESLKNKYSFGGNSEAINNIEKIIDRAAPSEISILIEGENGSGKEIAARRIHYSSKRASGPFIALNCASIPGELLESELFGYKKGSFTGATHDKDGLFIKAHQGTLFLDEIGDMPLELQAKLLRVLEEKEVTPIGESQSTAVDARILSATNRKIFESVKEGLFREDLFYRLNALTITVPPLRERVEDIPHLIRKFIIEFCYENNNPIPEIKTTAFEQLSHYYFPGNVRELKNIVHRTLILNDSNNIEEFYIENLSIKTKTPVLNTAGTLQDVKHSLLKNYLKERLDILQGDKKVLSQELEIHINNLYRLLKKYNL